MAGGIFNSFLGTSGTTAPVIEQATTTANQKKDTSGMVGSIVSTAGNLIGGFNYKQQENEIELARIQAEAAKANADATANNSNKKYIYVAVGVVVLIVLVVLLKPKSN